MQVKTVYWKRFNYTEMGFSLIEVFENGKMVLRKFKRNTQNEEYFDEISSKKVTLKGRIKLEKIRLDADYCVQKSDFTNRLEVIGEYSLENWEEARNAVLNHQQASEDDLTIDYHTVLAVESDSIQDDLQSEFERFEYPIVKFRFNFNEDCFQRRKHAAYSAIEFSPTLNERLYFHYIPENRYLTMTGDDLFALHTKYSESSLTEEGFNAYVEKMKDDVEKKRKYYRSLIIQQRERRAMLETDVIGDLYPR